LTQSDFTVKTNPCQKVLRTFLTYTNFRVQVNLQGTYAITGKTITFEQNADTFVRDMTWTYDNGTLVGSDTFSEATITVKLRKK